MAINADNIHPQKRGSPNGLFLLIVPYLMAMKPFSSAADRAACTVRFNQLSTKLAPSFFSETLT